jgi:hypothetical protein
MIVFFGIRSSEILNDKIDENCTKCEAQRTLRASVHQKFFHIFWAPCFPIEKTGAIYCTNCNVVVPQERLIPHFKNLYLQVQAKAKAPWWSFLGPMFLVFIITVLIVESKIKSSYSEDYINLPEKKDLYEVVTEDNNYTLYFVKDVSNDSVYVLINEYQTNLPSGLTDLESKNYKPEVYAISKKDLKSMYVKGDILDVKRSRWYNRDPPSSGFDKLLNLK